MAQLVEPDADAPPAGVRVNASLPGSDRRGRWAPLLSLVLHGLVIYFALRVTASAVMPEHSPIGDAIRIGLGGGGGGGGQGGVAMPQVVPQPPAATPPPVVPPPVPTVVPPPPVPVPVPVATEPPTTVVPAAAAASPVAAAGSGTGTGGGNGSGAGTGTGSGEGPGTGSGKGGGSGAGLGGFLPESKFLSVPPIDGTPKELRGKAVEVTFYITAAGLVSDIKVAPPILNKDFARKFDVMMRGYTFKPARDAAGNKIASVYPITFTFGGK